MAERSLGTPLRAPVPAVLKHLESALRRQGFVSFGPLDLRAALRDRVGAQLPALLVLFVFNPATTHRVLRYDAASAARSIAQVVVQETADGVVVRLPDPGEPVAPAVEDIVRDMRRRLAAELDRIPGHEVW